ncbi:MAG: ATP-dependent helicase HrpB [Caulobacteraceae bacterium]|nr:ATP-dependent helicase HrpB [Caulobacteraceae bacterium]
MLPIHDVLDALRAALETRPNAVLVAPPGAGKTTVTPLALLDAPWLQGRRIIMLEPRRLAARAAAQRMAVSLGEPVGQTVGFRVRMQSRVSAKTRIEVVTEGVFTRMVLDDPGLSDVACVIFDEFHERSLDADLGLALARDAQGLLRDDLRILVMSATLDGAAVAAVLDDAPVIESEGRSYPVETRYLGRDPALRIEESVVRAIRKALAETEGGVLAFLPGQGEILRVAERLAEQTPPSILVAPLFGALDPKDQDLAISPPPPGRRKVVLATSIAETSLTLEDVRVVVDCGLARVPRYDPASGLTRLATVRVSRAAADQRRGRAGRTAPGICYRLWDEAETRALPAFAEPEIWAADLSGLALDLARWGARDLSSMAFLDAPPAAAYGEALALLRRLEAIDDQGVITPHGEALAAVPLAPRLAHMLLQAAEHGQAARAAEIAALLGERNLGGRDTHLTHRLEGFARDRSPRARDARSLAARWASGLAAGGKPPLSDGALLALAFPERIARTRGGQGEFQLMSGRGVHVEPTDVLARERWIAVGELGGGERSDRILLAAPITEAEIMDLFDAALEQEDRIEESPGGRVRVRRLTRLGRLTVRESVDEAPPAAMVTAALLARVRASGLADLPWGPAAKALRQRLAYLRAGDPEAWPDLSDEALIARLDDWLAPMLVDVRKLADIGPDVLDAALRALVPWDVQRRLEAALPTHWTAPTGTRAPIDYEAEGGPRVEIRVQEVFGLDVHPLVGGRPLVLALLSPARRPIQMTKDLPGFWRGSWKDVRAEMRGRYPKHPWPEAPQAADPTTRAKPRS